MTRHQSLMNGGYDDHRINTLLRRRGALARRQLGHIGRHLQRRRSEEHTSELQSLMRISYAVFCLKKKNTNTVNKKNNTNQKQNIIVTSNKHNLTRHT